MVADRPGVEIIMGLNTHEAQQMGRIEAKVDILIDTDRALDGRITVLERFTNRAKGIVAFITFLGGILAVVLVSGCAHFHSKTYDPNGAITSSTVSTVIGRGDTVYLRQCIEGGFEGYTTSDTGLSENGKEAIAEAVAAGVRAAIPGLP
jgi:hypothetical protein